MLVLPIKGVFKERFSQKYSVKLSAIGVIGEIRG